MTTTTTIVLTDLFPDLLRQIVCFAPETLGALAFVSRALYAVLLGPDVAPYEPHWRAWVTRRRWPAYAHIEPGKNETWRDLARGWRALAKWDYVHVREPRWTTCNNHASTAGICFCSSKEHDPTDPVEYHDVYHRIDRIPPSLIGIGVSFELIEPPLVRPDSAAARWYYWLCDVGKIYRGGHVCAVQAAEIAQYTIDVDVFVAFI